MAAVAKAEDVGAAGGEGDELGIGTEEKMPAVPNRDTMDDEIEKMESQFGGGSVADDDDDASAANRRFSEDMVKERSPRGRFLRFNQQLSSGDGKRVFTSYDTVDGLEVAWNEIDIRNMSRAELTKLQQELAILSELRHKHVISIHNRWRVGNEKVVYITNLTASGSLKEFCNRVKTIRWKAVKRWSRQLLRGLQYLHNHDPPIIHRNLKCANVFINGASGEIVIGELGLSTQQRSSLSRGIGTPGYMAPEQYQEAYDERVDIFAFGMLALEMMTGDQPFAECGDNAGEIHRRVMQQIEPMGISRVSEGRARGFIRACIRTNDRPSATELLTHPFLKKNDDLDEEIVTLLEEDMSVGGESYDPSVASSDRRMSDGSLLPSHHDANSDDEWEKEDGAVSPESSGIQVVVHSRQVSVGSVSPTRASEGVAVEYPNENEGPSHTREVVENVEVELIDVQEAADATILHIEIQAQTKPDDQDKINNPTITFTYDLARDNPDSTVADLQLHVEHEQNYVFEDARVLSTMRAELAKVVGAVEEAIEKQMDLEALTKSDAASPKAGHADAGAAKADGDDAGASARASMPAAGTDAADEGLGVPHGAVPAGVPRRTGSLPEEAKEATSDATADAGLGAAQLGIPEEEDWFDPYDPELQAELARLQSQVDLLERIHAKKLSDFGTQRAAEEDKYLKNVEALKEKHNKVRQRLEVKEEKQCEQFEIKQRDLQSQMDATRDRFREAQRSRRVEEERVLAKYNLQQGRAVGNGDAGSGLPESGPHPEGNGFHES